MGTVTIRDLRNRGGEIVDRVSAGETLTVTRNGRPVAELRPLPRRPLSAEELVQSARHLPYVDPERLRRDLDELIDPWLFPRE